MGYTKNLDDIYLSERDTWYRFALGMLGNQDDALDVLHDAYEKVKRKLSSSKINNIKGYMFFVIKNGCYDCLKNKGKFLQIEKYEFEDLGESTLEIKDQAKLIHLLILKLPPVQRSVILLKDVEGYSYDELSMALDMQKNSIRVNLSMARKRIREAFLSIRNNELGKTHEG